MIGVHRKTKITAQRSAPLTRRRSFTDDRVYCENRNISRRAILAGNCPASDLIIRFPNGFETQKPFSCNARVQLRFQETRVHKSRFQ